MPDVAWHERRRHPRVAPGRNAQLFLPVVYDVEVIDISQSGLLLWCRQAMHLGQRAQIRAVIEGEPFTATMEVVRIDEPTLPKRRGRRCFAASFVTLDDDNRGTLQRFLTPPR